VKLPLPFIPLATHAFICIIAHRRKGLVGFQGSKLPKAVRQVVLHSKREITCTSIMVREIQAHMRVFTLLCCLQQQLEGFCGFIRLMMCAISIEEVAQLAFQRRFYPLFLRKQRHTDVFHTLRKALIADMDPVGTCPDGNWLVEHSVAALGVIRIAIPEMCSLLRRDESFTRLLLREPGRGDAEEADEDSRKIA
jgi:hypothetical protein